MKLLLLSVVVCIWSVVQGYQYYHQSPYSGSCGVYLTKGKDGGIYFANADSHNHGHSYGIHGGGNRGNSHTGRPAATTVHSSVTSTASLSNGNNGDYFGSYGGPGRYPVTTGHQGGGGQQSSSSSSSSYGGGGNNYGSGNYGDGARPGYDTTKGGRYGSSSSVFQTSGNSDANRNRGSGGNYGNGYGPSGGGSSQGGHFSNSGSSSGYGGNKGGIDWNHRHDTSPIYDNDIRFVDDVLYAHNSYRARHNTPPVNLDDRMTQKAQQWAEEMASGRANYGHSPEAVEGIYGESLQVVNAPSPSGAAVMERWYDEMENYDYKHPMIVKNPFNKRNSHFTAMVWYGTRKIGIGKATSPINGKSYVVVTYYPPGNSVDILENNVFPANKT